mmetsp:Transcript_33127/g.72984  ORF Transcript_33127/g.72984 Transcript_33127/m.72984 type:complete len:206 (+) Transcript_33127:338-955(+)
MAVFSSTLASSDAHFSGVIFHSPQRRHMPSADPVANCCWTGFHRHINTSPRCPFSCKYRKPFSSSTSFKLEGVNPEAFPSAFSPDLITAPSSSMGTESPAPELLFPSPSFAAGGAGVVRLARLSSFTATASQISGLSREKLLSKSSIVPSSLMCSSMAMYSSPFCKNVIRAPGGISVWAVLDLITSDSYANVNAECANPFSDKYL